MRSLMVGLLAASMVLVTVPRASAQGVIELGRSTSGGILFSDEGGGNLTLNLCTQVVHGKCVGDQAGGPAWASGEFGQDNGVYILQGKATTTGTFTGCVGTTCNWTLSTANPGLNFEFRQNKNGSGTDFLDGTLRMLSLTEVPAGKIFLDTITVQLSIVGGLLAPYFGNDGVVVLQFLFRTTKSLALGGHQVVRLATGWSTTCSERM